MRRYIFIPTAAALALTIVLCSGCGPTRSVVSPTPAPTDSPVMSGASVIVPETSLPPLPGAMSGAKAVTAADNSEESKDNQLTQ